MTNFKVEKIMEAEGSGAWDAGEDTSSYIKQKRFRELKDLLQLMDLRGHRERWRLTKLKRYKQQRTIETLEAERTGEEKNNKTVVTLNNQRILDRKKIEN